MSRSRTLHFTLWTWSKRLEVLARDGFEPGPDFVNEVGADPGTGSSQGVSQGDGSAPGVEFVHVYAELLLTGEGLVANVSYFFRRH